MNPLIARTAAQALAPVLLVLAVLLLWRGHNAPGGGFIGGLVAGAAVVLRAVAFGVDETRRWLRVSPEGLIAGGLALALGAGVAGALGGAAFLDALWLEALPIGTPLVFDVGVAAVVVGVVVGFILPLWDRESTSCPG